MSKLDASQQGAVSREKPLQRQWFYVWGVTWELPDFSFGTENFPESANFF
jgi:hypothetical protein